MVDGIRIGTSTTVAVSLEGSPVVVDIVRSAKLAVCVTTPCPPSGLLVAASVIWSGPPA